MEKETKLLVLETNASDQKLAFRVPRWMRDAILESAKRSGRKLCAELILRLAISLKDYDDIGQVPRVVDIPRRVHEC